MRILMFSLDKSLLGLKKEGDALERHKKYGEFAESLDIIVFNKGKAGLNKISENVVAYPTNSLFKLNHIFRAYQIGEEICRQKKIDLIDCQDPFFTGLIGYLLKKKFKIPLEIHCHGDFFKNPYWLKESFLNYFYLLLGKFLIKKADAVRVVSAGIKDKLIGLGVAENKIRVIPTPVNLEKFERIDLKKIEKIKNQYQNKKIILFVGTLNKVKNLPLLINALNIIKQKDNNSILRKGEGFICLIIGQGREEEEIKSRIKIYKLEENVKLLGGIEHSQLVNYYRACDFLVLPSLSESFGKVILEAAAAGKPAIATDTTGASELIINGETGFLTPINNQEKLAEKIYFLLNEENLAEQLGEKAKKRAKEKFEQKESIEKIINFWRKIDDKFKK